VIVFVASPRAYWINGGNIPVDGLEQPYAPIDIAPGGLGCNRVRQAGLPDRR
jgi:hypothetical protein